MANTQHTPGPWYSGGEGRSIGRNDEMTFLFALTQSRVTKKEQRANARLASAAPDLLEALETIAKTFAECVPGDDCKCYEDGQRIAEEAIAKAKEEVTQ
jgi:hypothetical protein